MGVLGLVAGACPCLVGQALPGFPAVVHVMWAAQPVPGCPAWVCALAGRRCPGSTTAISLTSPSLFCQVCNCNKYLKVSRERMRQLVEGSRQVSREHSAGEWVGAHSWA